MFQARMALLILSVGWISSLGCFRENTRKNETKENEKERKEDFSGYLKPIAEAERVTLYSIDGRAKRKTEGLYPNAEQFHGYPVLGKLELKNTQFVDINVAKPQIQEIAESIINGHLNHPDNSGGDCFAPRHALRAEREGKITEYVICFQCDWINVYSEGKSKSIVTTKEPQEVFNRILKQATIPIVP